MARNTGKVREFWSGKVETLIMQGIFVPLFVFDS